MKEKSTFLQGLIRYGRTTASEKVRREERVNVEIRNTLLIDMPIRFSVGVADQDR